MTSSPSFRTALASVPDDIVVALEREMADLESRFARHDWDHAELKGGRLAEALLRYLEWKQSNQFTPIGEKIDRTKITNAVENDATLPDGVRFHVRRCAELLMDVRNKRDVAHLGEVVDVEEMDARLMIRLASWSIAEIVREEGQLTPKEAQSLIDRFSATHVPLVEEIGGDLIVVATNLKAATQSLIALYHTYPDPMTIKNLQEAVRYQHSTRFRDEIIADHQANGLVHVKDDQVYLTRKGSAWLEANVEFELHIE